jgi:hypothetical protein
MALGRSFAQRVLVPHGPPHGPQHFFDELQRLDIRALTHTRRARDLSTIPKRTGVFFGNFHGPLKVQRIPPMIPEQPNYAKVRDTLVARQALVGTVTQNINA